MTNTSSKADTLRPKQGIIRRLTRSIRKVPHVKLSDKKGKAVMVEAEPKKQIAEHEDFIWVEHIDLTSTDSDSSIESDPSEEIEAEEQTPPEKETTSEYKPVEYPIFPKDYFNLKVEDDGTEQFIELKDINTILPGSPDYLPERIPINKWWHEIWYDNDPCSKKTYQKMVQYSRLTSSLRIPIEEAKKKGIKIKTEKCWIDKVNWYADILKKAL